MDSANLQNNTLQIPKIGLGTYALNGEQCINSIADALNSGYRHIDTAQYYNNEAEVGKGIRKSRIGRDEVFITSKIWPSHFHRLEQAAGESLGRMQVEQLDLLLLHWPANNEETNKRAVEALLRVHQKGLAKYIGVSNFSIGQLEQALSQAPIVCNQVEYHPFIKQDKMLDCLRRHDLFLTAYSPLALGKAAKSKTMQQIAEKYHKTSSQVALRWLVQQDSVIAIPKASSHERRKENLEVFDFDLSDEDMQVIFGLTGEKIN